MEKRDRKRPWFVFLLRRLASGYVLLVPLIHVSCSQEATVLAGDYEAQGSDLLTASVVESIESSGKDCGQLNGGTRWAVERMVFHVIRAGPAYSIGVGTGGCVIEARQVGGVLLAEDATCQFADDALLVQLGIVQYTYDVFQLDTLAGTVNAAGVVFQNTNTGLFKGCHTTELRIVGFSR